MFTSFSVARNASGIVNDQGMRNFRFPIVSPSYQALGQTGYYALPAGRAGNAARTLTEVGGA